MAWPPAAIVRGFPAGEREEEGPPDMHDKINTSPIALC